jgi:hypothetical protein
MRLTTVRARIKEENIDETEAAGGKRRDCVAT